MDSLPASSTSMLALYDTGVRGFLRVRLNWCSRAYVGAYNLPVTASICVLPTATPDNPSAQDRTHTAQRHHDTREMRCRGCPCSSK
jgi:hypothetical protein